MDGKNKLKFLFLVGICCFICTGCDGDVTRDIRHDGFSYGTEFNCDYFFPKDKEDTSYKKIKYLTGTHVIDEDGKLYEISLGQAYSNNQNCRKADTKIVVDAIMDGSIARGSDGKYYYLTSSNNVVQYSEITNADNNFYIYDLLLKDKETIKVTTADSSSGLYYVLKKDGNVYGYIVSKADSRSEPVITSSKIVYGSDNYGGDIIDYNYAGNSVSTFVRTANKIYKVYATNGSECSKYADVECQYAMKSSDTLNEYKDRIIAYNGSTLITDYKRVFSATN